MERVHGPRLLLRLILPEDFPRQPEHKGRLELHLLMVFGRFLLRSFRVL
jgi:hypothetical protein